MAATRAETAEEDESLWSFSDQHILLLVLKDLLVPFQLDRLNGGIENSRKQVPRSHEAET